MTILSSDENPVNSDLKFCTGCEETKPRSNFPRQNSRPDGHRSRCKECIKKYSDAYTRRTFNMRRERKWENRYGLTMEEYNRMLADQGHVCAICGKPETGRANNGGVRLLAVDHCHATGEVRGLLCGKCNRLLGEFEDSPDLLRCAAKYLERLSTAHRISMGESYKDAN